MQVSGGGDRVVHVWSADNCTHFHTFRGQYGTVTVKEEGRGGRGDGVLGHNTECLRRALFVCVHYQSVGAKMVSFQTAIEEWKCTEILLGRMCM